MAAPVSRPSLDRVPPVRSRVLVAVMAPNVALGAYLGLVPDQTLFTVTQLAVLAHVLLGLVSLPLFVAWLYVHVVRRIGSRPRSQHTGLVRAVRLVVTVAAALAFVTGLVVLRSSDGMPAATWHRVTGLFACVPFGLHLALERSRRSAVTLLASLGVTALVLVGLRVAVRPAHAAPDVPPFARVTRADSLYDEAGYCGECHTGVYAEWARSTHARSLSIPSVRGDFTDTPQHIGIERVDSDIAAASDTQTAPCGHCHLPVSYYGDDPTPILQARTPTHDGITCSFCHTLRGFDRGTHRVAATDVANLPYYVSAPETVRRYLAQNARPRWLHAVGNWLIRWRPAMHRRDYHAAFLDTSNACIGCHGMVQGASYDTWAASPFATHDDRTETRCQDCHMVQAMTGAPVREPGTLVPWGPTRPQRRTHLFLGGNVQAPLQVNDPDMAAREHAYASVAMRVAIEEAVRTSDEVRVSTRVTNDLVGHGFPSMESAQRIAWIEVQLLGDDGTVLTTTTPPGNGPATGSSGRGAASPMLARGRENERASDDTAVPARSSRTYVARVPWPASAPHVARVRVGVRHGFDPRPIAASERVVER